MLPASTFLASWQGPKDQPSPRGHLARVLVDDFQIRVRGDGPIRHREGYVSRNIVMASRSGGRPLNAPHPGPAAPVFTPAGVVSA